MPRPHVFLAPFAGLLVALLFRSPTSRLVRHAPLSRAEIQAHLSNHTLVHIGGQHRGGTTLLWRALATDPAIAAHGGEPTSGPNDADPRELHGEGLFLQDVLPHFGLDHPPLFFAQRRVARLACAVWGQSLEQQAPSWLRPWVACRATEGIGGYALSAASRLGPEHPAASEREGLRLFAQWAAHWELGRPVLLEKSPSNAMSAGALHAMWRAAGVAEGSVRFIFISRYALRPAPVPPPAPPPPPLLPAFCRGLGTR